MNFSFNLWVPLVVGLAIMVFFYISTVPKRDKWFYDLGFYRKFKPLLSLILGIAFFVAVFFLSLHTPVAYRFISVIGFEIMIVAILCFIFTQYSFNRSNGEFYEAGVYRFSRHPVFICLFLFFAGLCMMADSQTPWSFVLYLLTILWIPYAEWTIGLKEKYLEDKYGEGFRQYRDRVPKYLLVA